MPTITPTWANPRKGVYVVTWATIGDSDTCTAIEAPHLSVKEVEVTGSFGSPAATVAMQKSNDNTNFTPMRNLNGTIVSDIQNYGEALPENPKFIRPNSTGGTTSSTTVVLTMSRA